MKNPRQFRTILRCAGASFILAAVWIGLRCFFCPCIQQRPITEPHATETMIPAAKQVKVPVPTLKQFGRFWSKPLRRPLVDPQSVASKKKLAVTRKRSLPNMKLLGIACESGHSIAMFATSKGSIELKGVGETLGKVPNGPQISAIEDRQVVLKYLGERITVPLENEKKRRRR